jgi:hypothetical protein
MAERTCTRYTSFDNSALLGVFWYTRVFALRAQDRAIRAEENLRYFVLTGKLLPSNLRMGQIIALRFAPNEELIALVDRATKKLFLQKISNKLFKTGSQIITEHKIFSINAQ